MRLLPPLGPSTISASFVLFGAMEPNKDEGSWHRSGVVARFSTQCWELISEDAITMAALWYSLAEFSFCPRVVSASRFPYASPLVQSNPLAKTDLFRSCPPLTCYRKISMAIQPQGAPTDCVSPSKFEFEFPHIPPAAQDMMQDVLEMIDKNLGADLLPSQTVPEVQSFRSPDGNAEGSVIIRSGRDRSYVDRYLVSWLHCTLPMGTLDFATLTVLMGPATDAPHLLLEFPISGGAKVTAVMDLLPRKDLAADVEYLKRVYNDTPLATLHNQCERDSRMKRYIPPSLYIRSATSPTALLYVVDPSSWSKEHASVGEDGGCKNNFESAIKDVVHPVARQVVQTWLDIVRDAKGVEEGDARNKLSTRDEVVRQNGIEFDLTSNLPRLFGEEITQKVVKAFRDAM